MNVFNRLVVILLLLLIIIATALVAIVPQYSLRLAAATFDWLRQGAAEYINSPNDRLWFASARVIVGGVVVLVCLVLIWLELRRPRKRTIRTQKLSGGEAQITVDSIERRLAYNIDQLPDVVSVNPSISGKARGVDVDMVLETSPDVDVPMKTEEVIEVTREVIVERMGLKMGKVNVKIKHAPYPKE